MLGRGRRGDRDGDDEHYDSVPTKPSTPATLFDFLSDKIPDKSKLSSYQYQSIS